MPEKKSNKQLLIEYAGLAFQLLAGAGLATWAGFEIDKWIKSSFPLFVWLLPLLVIIGMIVKAVKDTSKK